jgi:hypothetical protein
MDKLNEAQITALDYFRLSNGRNRKSALRAAWLNDSWCAQGHLRHLRNAFGEATFRLYAAECKRRGGMIEA